MARRFTRLESKSPITRTASSVLQHLSRLTQCPTPPRAEPIFPSHGRAPNRTATVREEIARPEKKRPSVSETMERPPHWRRDS